MNTITILKWTLLVSLLLGLSYSCKIDDDDNPYNDTRKAVAINFAIKNSQGEDMFDSSTPNYFDKNTIKVWYEVKGQSVSYTDISDFMAGYTVYLSESNQYFSQVYLNADIDEEYPTTVVEWNTKIADTIKGHWATANSSIEYDSLWINNQLLYVRGSSVYPYSGYIEETK